eukprot:COSAG05_NODE_296_length_11959_cov_17.897639_5_plen_90_part_00
MARWVFGREQRGALFLSAVQSVNSLSLSLQLEQLARGSYYVQHAYCHSTCIHVENEVPLVGQARTVPMILNLRVGLQLHLVNERASDLR